MAPTNCLECTHCQSTHWALVPKVTIRCLRARGRPSEIAEVAAGAETVTRPEWCPRKGE